MYGWVMRVFPKNEKAMFYAKHFPECIFAKDKIITVWPLFGYDEIE